MNACMQKMRNHRAILCLVCIILGRNGAEDWHWNLREQLMGEAKTSDPTDDKYDLPLPQSPLQGSTHMKDEDDDRSVVSSSSIEEVISKSYLEGSSRECRDQPPFLYVTLHDYSNILKYTLDGCLVDHKILGDSPIRDRVELRGMAISLHPNFEGHLYVANAGAREPQILLYGKCKEGDRRYFKETIVSMDGERRNEGADHAYAIALDADYNVFATFQHTDVVLRFDASTFEPLPLPPALAMSSSSRNYFRGTFHQYGVAGEHDVDEQGIRGACVVGHRLWVANENVGGVEIIDIFSGLVTDIVMVESPVGIAYSPEHDLVFIGSKKKHWEGAVLAVSRHTLKTVRSYRTTTMTHPTGLAIWGNTLYVGEQFLNKILSFDIPSGDLIAKVVDDLPGEIEQIMISDC